MGVKKPIKKQTESKSGSWCLIIALILSAFMIFGVILSHIYALTIVDALLAIPRALLGVDQ